jgi:hypothetical protein
MEPDNTHDKINYGPRPRVVFYFIFPEDTSSGTKIMQRPGKPTSITQIPSQTLSVRA